MKTNQVRLAASCLAVLISLGSTASVRASSTLDGLVGYWPLDEGQGDRAANLMGLDGNLFGSTGHAAADGAAWAAGRLGGAIRFARGGRGLTVQPMRELECPQAVTVAAWVKLDNDRQTGFVWNREQAYRLGLDSLGQRHVRFQLDLDGKWAGNWLLSRTALEPDRWYHVAGVYDGRERRIYVDGQLDARAPASGAISGGGKMTIGEGFSGLIDEVRVWNRGLSEEELARAMTEDAGRFRAGLRPADALRFYPVESVGMLHQTETAEVAVFNSAHVSFSAGASVALRSPTGKTLAADSPRLSIPPRGTVHVRLAFRPDEPGMHSLTIRVDDRDLLRMPLYVLEPYRRQPPGALKLQKVASVDLAQDLGPDQLCEDGSSRVVESALGRYREAGDQKGSRFVARLTLRRPGLHLLRVKYPDDKARTCEVVACSFNEADLYNAETGYLTGVTYPVSNRFQTLECLLWARDVRQSVLFTTRETGRPAAAASVEAFEVAGPLPSSPIAGGPGERQIGLYWEDAAPLPWCAGAEGTGMEAFDRAVCNLCDLMDYAGENVLFHPAVWYNGPIYGSLVEESGTFGGRDIPAASWMEILLKRFEERGFKFYPTFNVHQLPSLVTSGNADVAKVRVGEPTFNAVTRDGQVASRTWHNRPPAYNAIHPQVKQRILSLVRELAERHGASQAFGGIAFHLTRCQLLQLGGLDVGYDDWTVAKFEHDTGTKVPVDPKDPERFGKRCDWLLASARESWIRWRCGEVASYYGEAARILRDRRAELRLVAVVLHPLAAVHADLRKQWEQGTRLVDLSREAGIDPALIGRQPGVAVQKHLGPADYRFNLAGSRPGSEPALLSVRAMDFCDDQLRDYRVAPQFGVFLYNRYFESAARRQKALACDWYRDPVWLATAIVPGGDHFMEYYAHAVAALDATLIVNGGFTIGTVGHEAQVERFARVFRLLPAGSWSDVPGLGGQVVGRSLQAEGRSYLYVVNRSPAAVEVALPVAVAKVGMQPLGGCPALRPTGRGQTVELGPYELAAWARTNAAQSVRAGELMTQAAAARKAAITDPNAVLAVSAIPRPSYLRPVVDPAFGTTIIRVADDADRPIAWTESDAPAGTWSKDARHHYVDDQPWNSDGSLLVLENRGRPSIVVLDGRTYRPKFPLPGNYERGQDRWHPSPQHPHERLNVKGTRLEWFDVVRGAQTRSWTLPFPVTGDIAGSPSRDGRYIVLTDTREGSKTGRMFVVDMDPQPPYAPYPGRRIGPPRDLFFDTGLSNLALDWAAISPSGRYAVVLYTSPWNDLWRVYDVNPESLALTPRPLTKTYPGTTGDPEKGFLYNLGHGDLTLDPFDHNEDVAVGQEHAGNAGRVVDGKKIGRLLMARLRDGQITPLSDPEKEAYPFHVSARNFDRPGWVYATYYPAADKRFNDEIVAVKLDGSKSVERVGHTHSDARGLYRAEPHAVPSRDGRRVIFASNWATGGGSSSSPKGDIKAYVVEIPNGS